MTRSNDAGLTIGMSLWFEMGLEDSVGRVADLGFEAVEVFHGQIGPRMVTVPVTPTHAGVAGETVRAARLEVSTLNCAGHPGFDPIGQPEEAAKLLGEHLRWADAMSAPRVLIWDGIVDDPAQASTASGGIARVVEQARSLSGLEDPPAVSIELHPFTFVLAHRKLREFAAAMRDAGAGICLDFCHFGVAWGERFIDDLDDDVLDSVNHIHYSDTDCRTSEFHFPPGLGTLDLEALTSILAGRSLPAAWDLFGWPAPAGAVAEHFEVYQSFVTQIAN